MRIGMILDKTFPPDPRVENEAVSLIKEGHSVFLFCLKYTNIPKEEIKGIKVKRYQSNRLIYKLSALAYTVPFYTKIMQKKIAHFIKENKIEAIHIHDIRIAQAVFNANKKTNLPIVLDLHDNLPEVMQFYLHLQKFPGKYIISPKKWKKKEEEFIQKATKVITVSPEFVLEVIDRTKISKQKIALVPNTVLPSFYKSYTLEKTILKKFKDKYVLLYLGDTALRRGLLTPINSLLILQKQIPNIALVIVGKSTTDNVLKKRVNELQINHLVYFEGWQNIALFPSYINASNICISPLERSVQHDVAYANKIFQYMSFGKPLLVSNATAQKRIIEKANSGLVHQEKNTTDFTEKVITLHQNPILAKELGKNGENFIKKQYNWDITSKKLITLYSKL